jgi:CRISPR type I-D-associated protein Csc1
MAEMQRDTDIYHCTIVPHDYLFFTTLGIRDTTMTNYIGNYALNYAINRHVSAIHRNVSGTVPHYGSDMMAVSMYATPAFISDSRHVPFAHSVIAWENQPKVAFSFNSVATVTQLTDKANVSLPQIGRKYKQPPLNHFEFFSIGGKPEGLVRLGKKQVPCRIYSRRLTLNETSDSLYAPSHPINVNDLKTFDITSIKSGELIKQTPPLLVNALLRGRHYRCFYGKKEYLIAMPDAEKYPRVYIPCP